MPLILYTVVPATLEGVRLVCKTDANVVSYTIDEGMDPEKDKVVDLTVTISVVVD